MAQTLKLSHSPKALESLAEQFKALGDETRLGLMMAVAASEDAEVIYVSLGRVEGKIPPAEQVKGEVYKHGDRIKCFVVDVKQGEKGPEVTLSRTHPAFVKMLFALEVPEVKERVVDIVGIAREPGATVMKYNQSPCIGSSVALIASEPGLEIGPGGKPNFL